MSKVLQEAENAHYKFQLGCYFTNSKEQKNVTYLWSRRIRDFYWNYATKINFSNDVKVPINKIITFYQSKHRSPTIYFTPFTKPRNLPEILRKIGFKSMYKDAWMFYKKSKVFAKLPQNFIITSVKTKKEMRLFADLFQKCYGGASPTEPYGTLPKEYGESVYSSFHPQGGKKTIHYIGFLDGTPVGIASLIYRGNYAGIYSIGTLPTYRGRGVGSALTLNAVAQAFHSKAKVIFLQPEKGSYNEKYYAKLGFVTKFVGEGFVLS